MIFKLFFERISKNNVTHVRGDTCWYSLIILFVISTNLEHLFLYTSDCYLLFLESSGIISHTRAVELLDKNKTMGKSRKVGGGGYPIYTYWV